MLLAATCFAPLAQAARRFVCNDRQGNGKTDGASSATFAAVKDARFFRRRRNPYPSKAVAPAPNRTNVEGSRVGMVVSKP